ncbi:hydroxyacyl-thioester dehydratase type-like protein isoform X1 [Carex rostrata]
MQRIQQLSRIPSRSQFRFPISPFSSAPIEPPPPLLSIGHVLHASRIFTGQDVAHYAEVTGDYNPVHLDSGFATSVAGFDKGRVVHGMLVASLFPSIIASNFPGAVYVSQDLKFKLPVYVQDEVAAQVQAINIKQIKNRYVVKFTTRCFTNEVSLAVDGEAVAVLPTLHLNE